MGKRRMRFVQLAALAFAAIAVCGQARAVEVELRPDLIDRVTGLAPVYPVQSASAVTGAPSPMAEAEADSARFVSRSADGAGQPAAVLLVSGIIEKGDAEKLEKALQIPNLVYIVFDSPGGSFSEGFAIGEKISFNLGSSDPNVAGVYVLSGMRCLSACAVAFSLAQESRFVESGAQLGFHMPFFTGEKAEQQGAAAELLNLAYDITGAFNKLLESGINPPKLLTSMLSHRTADSFFLLEGGLKTWNYGFAPVAAGDFVKPTLVYGLDLDAVSSICNVLFVGGRAFREPYEEEYGSFSEFEDKDIPLLTDLVRQTGHRSFARGSGGGFSCEVRVNKDETVGVAIWRGDRQCLDGVTPANREDWCAVSPNQTFATTIGMLADTLGCTDGKFDPRASVHGFFAKREVNVRRQPALDAQVIGALKKNDRPTVIDCAMTRDHQAVWYKLKGTTTDGWVSARYLGGQTNVYRFFDAERQSGE